jgi:chloramphenicol-sensitive protein RarD
MTVNPRLEATGRSHTGFLYALGAYLAWGVVPAYFKLLAHVPPLVVLAHRILWSTLFLAVLLTVLRKWDEIRAILRSRRMMLTLLCSTVMIAANWFVFIFAISKGQVLQASLGYFINPLVNVLLGVLILHERLRAAQVFALLLAAVGVVILTVSTAGVPWVALSLAFSFGFYGLLRKTAPVGPVAGLSVETALLFPAALLVAMGSLGVSPDTNAAANFSRGTYALLICSGVVTAIPLLLFAAGARRLRLSTLGFLQYLSPTCQFLLAVFVYHEPFSSRQLLSFALIWAGLAAYTLESILNRRESRSAATASTFPVAVPE